SGGGIGIRARFPTRAQDVGVHDSERLCYIRLGGMPSNESPLPARCTSSLMWTAPEGASAIYSAGARSVAAPTSEVSPVRSPLAARPPGALRHNRATPARHRVLPPSRCLRGRRAGCPATPETGPAGPPASAPRQPTVAVDCADRQAGGIGQPPAASSAQLRQ